MSVDKLLDALPYMGYGMLGIFFVVLFLIAFTYGLTILFTLLDRKMKKMFTLLHRKMKKSKK